MATILSNLTKNIFSSKEEMERIADLPLIKLRVELKLAYQDRKFSQEQYEDFVERLGKVEDLKEQKTVAAEALTNEELKDANDLDMTSPARLLLWAATLARLMDKRTEKEGEEAEADTAKLGPIKDTKLWKQIRNSIPVLNQSIAVAKAIDVALRDDGATFDWGGPGTWFYHDPKKNHINLDLFFSMLVGFEFAHSVNLHEIGHSELSGTYPDRMKELYKTVEKLIDPRTVDSSGDSSATPKQMTKEEQMAIAKDVVEWQLRFKLFHVVEDNCVNQFSVNQGQAFKLDSLRGTNQDMGDSLNHVSVMLQGGYEMLSGIDKTRPIQKGTDAIKSQHDQVEKAIKKKMEENGVDPADKAWAEASLKQERDKAIKQLEDEMKEKIEFKTNPLSKAEIDKIKKGDISPEAAEKLFEEIRYAVLFAYYEANGLFKGTDENWEKLRIFPKEIRDIVDVSNIPEAKGRDSFEYLYDLCAGPNGIRNLQPQPGDRFFPDTYPKIVEETSKKRNDVHDHIWEVYLKPFADVLQKDYEKKLEERLDKQQQQQQQQGQGQPGEGQPGGGGGGNGDPMDMDGDLQNDVGDMSKTPGEGRGKEQKEKKSGWGEDPGQGGGMPEPGEGQGGGKDPMNVKDMKDQTPVDDKLSDQDKANLNNNKPGPGGSGGSQPGSGAFGGSAGSGAGVDFATLAKGDWTEYNKIVAQLRPAINEARRSLRRIREKQEMEITDISPEHSFTAEDGNIIGRLDRDKVMDINYKRNMKIPMQVDELRRFKADETTTVGSSIEMFYGIDGSGSMTMVQLAGGVNAQQVAVLSAVVGYEACREEGIDSYIIVWGDPSPKVIATPESDRKEVGKALQGLMRGTGSGTDMAPAFVESIDSMAKHKAPSGTISGSSHFIMFSDGDIYDPDETKAKLMTISRLAKTNIAARNMTFDVAVLKPARSGQTQMENVFNEISKDTRNKNISVIRGEDPQEIPLTIVRNMLRRVERIKVSTVPDTTKRRDMKALHSALKK